MPDGAGVIEFKQDEYSEVLKVVWTSLSFGGYLKKKVQNVLRQQSRVV